MTPEQLKVRTKSYALRILKVVQALPENRECNIFGSQLLRAGTSVGANYRAVCRAKSPADFLHKLRIVEEKCDETLFWMEMLVEGDLVKESRLKELMSEGNEILSIIVSSAKTIRSSSGASIVNRKS
ncbi:MAG: four helix bundle protein [Verrucomicrobia bacterium]|nr:four helix bundle protein [Verrucomicrobiota bacterium]